MNQEDFPNHLFSNTGGNATLNLQQAGLKSKGIHRAGGAAKGHEGQEHLYNLQMPEALSVLLH